jgi:preprotein translocase subunit SecY
MAAGKYSFIIEQGSTVEIPLIYKDNQGNPVNLTQYNSKMQIRESYSSSIPIITLSSSLNPDGTGLNMSNAVSGGITIYIASCTSSMFNFHDAVYDLDIISGSGNCPIVNRILEGKVRLSKEVTMLS